MTTAGTTSLFPLRSLSRWRNPSQVQAHALPLASSSRLPHAVMTMFKRANATFEAKNSKAPQPQPFLSSITTSRPDANIKDQFQRHPGTSFGSSRLGEPSNPKALLEPRASNPAQPPRTAQSVNRSGLVNGEQFASLYSNRENSFREEPDVMGHTDDKAAMSIANVPFFENDFSDDENLLDMDYQCPSALPSALPTQRTQVAPSAARRGMDAPADDSTSPIPWSQSSPSHMQPSRSVSVSQSNSARSAKRPAPEGGAPTDQPVAKKLAVPLARHQYKTERTSSTSQSTRPGKSQSRGAQSWDRTADELKAQQKKLKDKGKSSEVMQQAIKSQTAKQSAISLSHEQEVVKELVCDGGKSVFFTGPAGTGKSVLMRSIIAQLKKKFIKDPERLAVTASTGLAACNIGGMTLHSFSGIGLGKEDVATLVKKIRRNPKVKNRWIKTKVLVIDEISMVDGDLFDKLSQIGRTLRNNGRPWGGIQLVITGDFFQLPPVPDHNSRDAKFTFDAATWNTSIDHTIGLTEVFRQKDPEFAQMLNEMRLGHISEDTVNTFKSLSRPLEFGDGLEVTELFPTRSEVENSNQRRLRELPGEVHRYEALDSGDPKLRDKLLSNMMAPKTLELKKGAQVMLIKNLDDTLVNGSLGTVIGFSTESVFEISGGLPTDEDAHDDDDDASAPAKRTAKFRRELDKGTDKKKWPLVQFHAVDGSSRIMLCIAEPWKVETPTGEVQASREQLPLILAWALSIHKAQGQTLARVKVDLGKVFEKGQAYVALSRAVTQEGLQVLRFDKKKVMAHPRVVTFYQQLYSAESAVKPKRKAIQTSMTGFATTAAPRAPAKKSMAVDHLDDDEEAVAYFAHAY